MAVSKLVMQSLTFLVPPRPQVIDQQEHQAWAEQQEYFYLCFKDESYIREQLCLIQKDIKKRNAPDDFTGDSPPETYDLIVVGG